MNSQLKIRDPINELTSPVCTRILSLFYNQTFSREQIEEAIEQRIAELVCLEILPIDVNREFVLQYITTQGGLTTGFGYVYFVEEKIALSFVGYNSDGSNLYSEITVTNGSEFPQTGTLISNDGKEMECYYEMIPGTRKDHFEYAKEKEIILDFDNPPKNFNWADECEREIVSSSATIKFFVRINNKFGNILYNEKQLNFLRENPSRDQNKEILSESVSCNLLINQKLPDSEQLRILSVTCCEQNTPNNMNEIRLHHHFKKFNTSSDKRIFRYFSQDLNGEKKEVRTTWPVVFCSSLKSGRIIYFVRFDGRTKDEESALIMNYITKIDNVTFSTRWASVRSNQAMRVSEYQLNEAYEPRKNVPARNNSGKIISTIIKAPK